MERFASSVLLIIDVQNDFCHGGNLAVQNGDDVVLPLNKLSSFFAEKGAIIATTQDWHPANHVSFASSHSGKNPGEIISTINVSEQILWPSHCVAGTQGADFHRELCLDHVNIIIRKGFRAELDSYSAFFENDRLTPTGLEGYLKGLSIESVYIGGLAADYCVFYSAIDAKKIGFKTYVIKDAVRGVNFPEGSVVKAFAEMTRLGINLIDSGELL